jgi:transcriptional regulator with XRE-family HTH domain
VLVQTIRELREARGWTQFELAIKVGVQPTTIYTWESGKKMPMIPQLRKLAEAFGVSMDDIITEAERKKQAA